jgi:amino acid adenylation domain-containing protein
VGRLARRLRRVGVGPDQVVGVCLERGAELVAAVHAVVAAGGAYLALEPDYPAQRLGVMVADADARVVVTTSALAGRLPPTPGVELVLLDAEAAALEAEDPGPLELEIPPDCLAYVLFTSGSTGRPKGVGVSHRAIGNRLWWMQEAFGLTPTDRVLHKTPFSFDVAVWELFWPLLVGAGLVVARPGGHRDPAYLAELMAAEQVTTVHFVPSMLDAFLEEPDLAGRLGRLRRVVCSGEALPAALAARCLQRLPGVELHNLYGPTEAAVDVSWHACRAGEPVVPIGRPVANTRLEVLGPGGQRVPVGSPGELCIGGVQLARGYLGRPALTAERFVPDPYAPAPGGRLYRTGDLARWRPDGELEYLGRLDFQVKVRGHRIELGEIEAELARQPEVRAAVVLARDDGTGPRLVAYLVGQAGAELAAIDWHQRLRAHLPEHMLPTALVYLDTLPLTANGKIDRNALPPPTHTRRSRAFVPPRDPLEARLATLFEETLGVDPVGVHDDFFELGGHSLLALRLAMRVRRDLGRDLPVATTLAAPTVAQLAAALRRPQDSAPPGRIVPLQPAGERTPLFLVHALGGQVFRYLPLTRRLGADQPVYAIAARGLAEGEDPHDTLAEMVGDYLAHLRAVRPHGPYVLGGYCIGGNIALEMARALRVEGEQVELVVLIYSDADEPVVTASLEDDAVLTMHALAGGQLDADLGELHRLDPDQQLLAVIEAAARADRLQPDTADLEQARRFLRVFRANAHAVGRYQHEPYDGAVALLVPAQDDHIPAGADLGWAKVVNGRLRVHSYPGDRFSVLYEPVVAHAATELRKWMDHGLPADD